MNWWQRILRRAKMEEQLEKEMRFHLEQHAKELIASGVSPAEAQRRARGRVRGAGDDVEVVPALDEAAVRHERSLGCARRD